jgi:hypothetical protein
MPARVHIASLFALFVAPAMALASVAPPPTVPEPSVWALLATGAVAAIVASRIKRDK